MKANGYFGLLFATIKFTNFKNTLKMKKIFLAITVLLLCSCAARLRTSTDYDRNVNFSRIQSFGIYRVSTDFRNISELDRNRIYSAIRTTMRERGFIESDRPDVWINAVAVINTQESLSSTTTQMGGPWGSWGVGGMHRPYFWSPTTLHTQYHVNVEREGVLILDIIDARTGHLIWQSVGRRRIDNDFRRNNQTRIDQYVREMLNAFPPR